MKVGFTGTRRGMNRAQLGQLDVVLYWLLNGSEDQPEFHHGGARGADREAHDKASFYAKHVHPCHGVVRDFGAREDVWHEVFPPLARNHEIVEACDLLIAAPLQDREEQRSGTWATVRYARAAGKPVVMLSRGEP